MEVLGAYDEESLNFRLQQKHIQGDPIEFLNDYKDWINQKILIYFLTKF